MNVVQKCSKMMSAIVSLHHFTTCCMHIVQRCEDVRYTHRCVSLKSLPVFLSIFRHLLDLSSKSLCQTPSCHVFPYLSICRRRLPFYLCRSCHCCDKLPFLVASLNCIISSQCSPQGAPSCQGYIFWEIVRDLALQGAADKAVTWMTSCVLCSTINT